MYHCHECRTFRKFFMYTIQSVCILFAFVGTRMLMSHSVNLLYDIQFPQKKRKEKKKNAARCSVKSSENVIFIFLSSYFSSYFSLMMQTNSKFSVNLEADFSKK